MHNEGPLHTQAKSRDYEIMKARKKVSKAVSTHLQNHVVWSRTLKHNVKSHVMGPSTKCYLNEFLIVHVLTYDKIK